MSDVYDAEFSELRINVVLQDDVSRLTDGVGDVISIVLGVDVGSSEVELEGVMGVRDVGGFVGGVEQLLEFQGSGSLAGEHRGQTVFASAKVRFRLVGGGVVRAEGDGRISFSEFSPSMVDVKFAASGSLSIENIGVLGTDSEVEARSVLERCGISRSIAGDVCVPGGEGFVAFEWLGGGGP